MRSISRWVTVMEKLTGSFGRKEKVKFSTSIRDSVKQPLGTKLSLASWWFEPNWKILSKLESSPGRGGNIWNHHQVRDSCPRLRSLSWIFKTNLSIGGVLKTGLGANFFGCFCWNISTSSLPLKTGHPVKGCELSSNYDFSEAFAVALRIQNAGLSWDILRYPGLEPLIPL